MIISAGAPTGFYFQSRDQAQAMAISRPPVFEVSSPMQMTIPMGSAKPDKPKNHVTFQTGTKNAPVSTPELQCELGWYISPFDDKKKRTKGNPTPEDDLSEALQSTISDTTISAVEEAAIRAEVREIMQKKFAADHATLGSNPGAQNEEIMKSGAAIPSESVIDLVNGSTQSLEISQPLVIQGSPISIASTSSHPGNEGNSPAFSRLSLGTDVAFVSQVAATMHWKPKEPPCFYGHISEDVHTWTSLVCHYLTFMGGSCLLNYPLARVCA